jgi:hypothetical protein
MDASNALRWPWNGLLLRKPLVRASRVVETHVLMQQPAEVYVVQNKDVVEEFAPQGADEALGEGVHVGRPRGPASPLADRGSASRWRFRRASPRRGARSSFW